MKDLFARNLSSAIREAANAKLAAKAEGQDDLTCDLIDRALELLERAAAKNSTPSLPDMVLPPYPPHGCDDCHDKEEALAIFDIEERPGCFVWLCPACFQARRKKASENKPASSTKKRRIPTPKPPVPAG